MNRTIPYALRARERFKRYNTRFFQNMAVPQELLDAISTGSVARDKLLHFGQWRLDFPAVPATPPTEDEEVRRVLLVAKKILTRGHITRLSPALEEKIRTHFDCTEFDATKLNLYAYLALSKQTTETTALFDSELERQFYEKTLSECLGHYYKRFVLPQVHLFEDDVRDDRRVDFLVTTPSKSIAVELDGDEHDPVADRQRDIRLREKQGLDCRRIKNEEVTAGAGENLQALKEFLQEAVSQDITAPIANLSKAEEYSLAVKFAHQLQLVLLESLLAGHLALDSDPIKFCFDTASVAFDKDVSTFLVESAAADLNELIKNLFTLYEVNQKCELTLSKRQSKIPAPVITFDENLKTSGARIIIQDISFNTPEHSIIANITDAIPAIEIPNVSEVNLSYFLKYIFRHAQFREQENKRGETSKGQFNAVARALQGKDTVVLLPTGSGKSVAFQLPSLLLPGASIVIDPLIALINDQIENLTKVGIDRAEGVTSELDPKSRTEITEAFEDGKYLFCYVAPERLQSPEFRNSLGSFADKRPVSLIVVDEAHCVSEWGHSFRTAYLNIGSTTRRFCENKGRVPPLIALTGTASKAVLRDVQRELQIKNDSDAIITPKSLDRTELQFSLYCPDGAKQELLEPILVDNLTDGMPVTQFYKPDRGDKTNCGIVFCPHVGGDFGVKKIAKSIRDIGIKVSTYYGKDMDAEIKRKNANDFKLNKSSIMVATNAFGMGIDKPNVKFTVHINLPPSIESFYQEAGRAGRGEGVSARCIIIYSNELEDITKKLLNLGAKISDLKQIMRTETSREFGNDVSRCMYFHLNSFPGTEEEVKDIKPVIELIQERRVLGLSVALLNFNSDEHKKKIEKAVYRLQLLGIVTDYTISSASDGGQLTIYIAGASEDGVIESFCGYIGWYDFGLVATEKSKIERFRGLPLTEFVLRTSEVLIDFIYETIERGRRRALSEINSMAERAVKILSDEEADQKMSLQDKFIRESVLDFLDTTYDGDIERVIKEFERAKTYSKLKSLFDEVAKTEHDAAELRGQVASRLTYNAEHPALLFLRAVCEIYCADADTDSALRDIEAGCQFAKSKYNFDEQDFSELYEFLISWMRTKIYNHNKEVLGEYIKTLLVVNGNKLENMLRQSDNINTEGELYAIHLHAINRTAEKVATILSE